MPGKRITDPQYRTYMKMRQQDCSQAISSIKSGFSERTGRRWEKKGCLPSQSRKERHWRTRRDFFEEVWGKECVPLLESTPQLLALTLLEHLQDKYPGQYPDNQLRTLQRRVKNWKAQFGQEKELMFRQVHPPGQLGLSDFTEMKGITITIQGKPFDHRLYHFRLAYSHWSYLQVIQGGESFVALSEGLQNALWRLGGVPEEHRTDSLSAAFKNLNPNAQADLTGRFRALNEYYGMRASRNNPGKSHENGAIESPHGHLKRRIEQALLLRGYYNFESVSAYQQFVDRCVQDHNRRNAQLVTVEQESLKPLPTGRTLDYEEVTCRVTTGSTITVKHAIYSVPPRLIGENLKVRIYQDRLVCYLGLTQCYEVSRVYTLVKQRRGRVIDYRHLIGQLSKKPQAFRQYVFREELFPSRPYKIVWDWIDKHLEARAACRLMVGLLKLASRSSESERGLGEALERLVERQEVPSLVVLEKRFGQPSPLSNEVLQPKTIQHSLMSYDTLLNPFSGQEVAYV